MRTMPWQIGPGTAGHCGEGLGFVIRDRSVFFFFSFFDFFFAIALDTPDCRHG